MTSEIKNHYQEFAAPGIGNPDTKLLVDAAVEKAKASVAENPPAKKNQTIFHSRVKTSF